MKPDWKQISLSTQPAQWTQALAEVEDVLLVPMEKKFKEMMVLIVSELEHKILPEMFSY